MGFKNPVVTTQEEEKPEKNGTILVNQSKLTLFRAFPHFSHFAAQGKKIGGKKRILCYLKNSESGRSWTAARYFWVDSIKVGEEFSFKLDTGQLNTLQLS